MRDLLIGVVAGEGGFLELSQFGQSLGGIKLGRGGGGGGSGRALLGRGRGRRGSGFA